MTRHGEVPDAAARGARGALLPGVRALHALGVSPNAVSVLGALLTLLGAALLVTSGPAAGAAPLAVGALADTVDGQLARLSGRASVFGSFLDSTLDRVSDAAWFAAAGLLATRDGDSPTAFLALWALVASFLVSYTRAKAESLGLEATVGVGPREARVALLILGVVLWTFTAQRAFFIYAIALAAILATVTVLQRVAHVARQRGNS